MTPTDVRLAFALEVVSRAPLIKPRSGSFILMGKATKIDRQLKAMCAVEARKGRVHLDDVEAGA